MSYLFLVAGTAYAVVCIAMHMRKINQARFWRFSVLATTFLPVNHQKRPEAVFAVRVRDYGK